jgi:methionyl aminopeptidase
MVPNFYDPRMAKEILEEGMVLALEPMVTAGSCEVETSADGWTVITKDRKRSCHFEHTVVIVANGAQILTQ